MAAAGYGRIVNMASLAGQSGGTATGAHYAASKGAIVTLTKIFAKELAANGVTVNAIAPGPILPPEDYSPAQRQAVEAATPLGEWGGAGEIAKAVLALIDSDFITGETIRVDGGRHVE
jgi:3-oxoacyl-[acyl-carrier protein] reductase